MYPLISSMCLFEWTQMVNGAALTKPLSYAGIYNNLFKSIYFYEFNRSYAPTTGKSYCNAPITPGIFEDTELGNPDNEYFECHGAQMYYIFGTVKWNGLPLRDENDLPFEQFIVDSWTSFARI